MAGGAEYQFVAWTRSGVGALLGGAAQSATLDLGASGQVSAQLATYGPADITGLDARAIVRTVPQAGVLDFEPNLFPSVELAHPALPWLVSGAADASGRVTPWIALVVVVDGPGVTLAQQTLSIAAPASPATELPMLSQAWAWAHAQAIATEGAALDTAALATSNGTARGRLVAPRQLVAGTRYIACIVPTTPGWTGTEVSITLPVYYAWRFATGPDGDFASLVRRVKPQPLDASIGHRTIDISSPGWGAPSASGATIEASGALRSPAWTPPVAPAAAAAIGTAIANELAAAAAPPAAQPPVLAPPSYGSAATRVDVLGSAPAWQATLNQDVGQRIAASIGADVIRGDVDTFVDAAWRSAGDTERINHALHLGELAGELAQRLGDKHLGSLSSDGELLAIARPLATRMTVAASQTLSAAIGASSMPQTALSASLRRLGRVAGPLTRQSAALTTGNMLAQIDAKQIVADPPKTLAASAAGFDAISIAAKTTARLELATPTLLVSSATHWATAATTVTTTTTTTELRAVEEPVDGLHAIEPLPISVTSLPHGEINTIPKLPTKGAPIVVINSFAAAARLHQQYITTHLEQIPDTRPPLGDITATRPLSAIRTAIASQWTATRGILPILGARITGVSISTFAPVAALPVLQQPMIQDLVASAPDLLMPGYASLASNRLAVASSNPDFVRAFLVGANEQLARELLWRRFPGALGRTWLQTFWGRLEPGADGSPQRTTDIPPIESWPAAGPAAAPDMLVLAVRADVLQRYPDALVYALAATWQGSQRVVGTAAPVTPVVATTLASDIALFGFDLAIDAVRGTSTPTGSAGYYFVIAEHPHAPRFGLAASQTTSPASWSEIAWADVAAADLAGSYLRVDGPLAQRQLGSPRWGADGAQMAAITLRPTVRVAVHASTLLS